MMVRIVRVTRTLYYEGPEEWVKVTLDKSAVPAKGEREFGSDRKVVSGIVGIPQFIREVEVKTKSPEGAEG